MFERRICPAFFGPVLSSRLRLTYSLTAPMYSSIVQGCSDAQRSIRSIPVGGNVLRAGGLRALGMLALVSPAASVTSVHARQLVDSITIAVWLSTSRLAASRAA